MASQAIFAQGTLLKIGDGATPTESFTTIAEVKSIDGPKFDTDDVDVTTHDTSDGFHEYIPGLKEGGELGFAINLVPTHATHSLATGLLGRYMEDGDKRHNFQLALPDGATVWTIPGYVKTFGIGAPVDNVLSADVSIKVSSRPTLA
jgi:predicted secreted protein